MNQVNYDKVNNDDLPLSHTSLIYGYPIIVAEPAPHEQYQLRRNPNLHNQRQPRSKSELATTNTNCCGCANPMPARLQKEGEEDVKIHLKFSIEGCFTSTNPFEDDDMKFTPYQLFNRGVTDNEWKDHVQRLCRVNNMRNGCCTYCISGLVVLLVLPFCLPYYCKNDASKIKLWDNELRKWQNDFNEECLIGLGMFCKTQSFCWVTTTEKGEKERHFERWIAFALTPEHSERLKNEPHLSGDIDDYCANCCGAYPESKCCVHPRG